MLPSIIQKTVSMNGLNIQCLNFTFLLCYSDSLSVYLHPQIRKSGPIFDGQLLAESASVHATECEPTNLGSPPPLTSIVNCQPSEL